MTWLKGILKLFIRRPNLVGLEQINPNGPAVFISNHLAAYGPLVLSLYFPPPFRPWVHADVTQKAACRDHLDQHFVRQSLKLKPPFSRWLAALLAGPAVFVMRKIRAIPVFRGKTAVIRTFSISVKALQEKEALLIFPENRERPFSDRVHDFFPGFTLLASLYYKQTGEVLPFYPLFIDRKRRTIRVGQAITADPAKLDRAGRQALAAQLRDAIDLMGQS